MLRYTDRRGLALCVTIAAVAAVVAAVATLAGVGGTTLVSSWVLAVAVATAAVACALRAAAVSGGTRVAWLCIAGGMAAWAGAEVVFVTGAAAADPLWLAQYPASALGLAVLVRARVGRVPREFAVEAAVGACAVMAVAAAVLPLSGGLLDVAYPAGDLLIVGLVAAALPLAGSVWSTTWTLLALAFAAQVVADGGYLLAAGGYVAGGPSDLGWVASALLVTCAAATRDTSSQRLPAAGGIATSVGFGSLAVGVQVLDHFARLPSPAIVLSALALVLLLVRVALLFRTVRGLLLVNAREARRDGLTALGNRRALLEQLGRSGAPRRLVIYDLDGFKAYNDAYGHPAGDALLQRMAARLHAFAGAEGALAYRLGGDEFCLLIPAGPHAEAMREGGAACLSEHGDGFSVTASSGSAPLPHPDGPAGALGEADAAMYAAKRSGRRSAARQSGDVLDAALREARPDLCQHDSDVARLAAAVAAELGLETAQVARVREAGRLHDVGKIAIPDAILDKPGPLDAEELAFIRRHTLIGERILSAAPDLVAVGRLVRGSHERWDGAGYPDGLAGEAIPLGARIVCVCDAFDAMVTDRPYQGSRTAEAALEELRRCSGTQFDPGVVRALARVLARSRAPAC